MRLTYQARTCTLVLPILILGASTLYTYSTTLVRAPLHLLY